MRSMRFLFQGKNLRLLLIYVNKYNLERKKIMRQILSVVITTVALTGMKLYRLVTAKALAQYYEHTIVSHFC